MSREPWMTRYRPETVVRVLGDLGKITKPGRSALRPVSRLAEIIVPTSS
jgi:hypothetical protein